MEIHSNYKGDTWPALSTVIYHILIQADALSCAIQLVVPGTVKHVWAHTAQVFNRFSAQFSAISLAANSGPADKQRFRNQPLTASHRSRCQNPANTAIPPQIHSSSQISSSCAIPKEVSISFRVPFVIGFDAEAQGTMQKQTDRHMRCLLHLSVSHSDPILRKEKI